MSSDASFFACCSGVNSWSELYIVAFFPTPRGSQLTPSFSQKSAVTIFPLYTPMLPVSVPGCATILSASIATKYPPLAAYVPIVTMTGLPFSRARCTSRRTVSLAT